MYLARKRGECLSAISKLIGQKSDKQQMIVIISAITKIMKGIVYRYKGEKWLLSGALRGVGKNVASVLALQR